LVNEQQRTTNPEFRSNLLTKSNSSGLLPIQLLAWKDQAGQVGYFLFRLRA
jgi:hypothetical protein